MGYESQLAMLSDMLEKCHLQSRVIDPTRPVDDRVDMGLRRLLGGDDTATFLEYFSDIRPHTVYRVTDVLLCRYIFLELPPTDRRAVLLVGPYMTAELSHQQILEQGERMGLSPKQTGQLEQYYATLPAIREEHPIFAMVNTFAEHLWGRDRMESADISREHTAAFMTGLPRVPEDSTSEALNVSRMEDRYRFENELMTVVSQGNLHKAELMMANFSPLAFETRTPDPLRNIKNYCIIMNTLLRKAAEKGGVHPVHLDTVSSDFARRVELIHSLSKIPDFMREMLTAYCNLVRHHSMKNYSPLVQKTILHIESDLAGDLGLSRLAQLGSVSPAYLSGLFKKETGQTLTAYVNAKRIHHAKHLLRTTGLQVQTVAQHCGILDLHYFCRLFKQTTGKTPTAYRSGLSFD